MLLVHIVLSNYILAFTLGMFIMFYFIVLILNTKWYYADHNYTLK